MSKTIKFIDQIKSGINLTIPSRVSFSTVSTKFCLTRDEWAKLGTPDRGAKIEIRIKVLEDKE